MDNLKEFKELIERYESITLTEIRKKCFIGSFNQHYVDFVTRNQLTGFGRCSTCILCKALNSRCKGCVYTYTIDIDFRELHDVSCSAQKNYKTYEAIRTAKTPLELLQAYKARAKHMRNILKQIDNGK